MQITDTHLGELPGSVLLGMDTDVSLGHVLDLVRAERDQADLLLATGDISSNGSLASYQRFYQLSQGLARHACWLPGNHDDWLVMQQALANKPELKRSVRAGNWQIIMLDSTTPGQPGGNLSNAELAFLRQTLESSTAKHVLLCLHHHTVPTGCDWLDRQQVINSAAFFQLISRFDLVRGVLCGHVHQSLDHWHQGIKLMATPSSCIQFAANSTDFKLDRLNPGYRWLELYDDGEIGTGVSRVTGVDFDVDYDQSSGY